MDRKVKLEAKVRVKYNCYKSTETFQSLNLFILKGATGLAGPQGLHGLQGTIFLVTCGVSQTILINNFVSLHRFL